VAVSIDAGTRAPDFSGQPSLPIEFSRGLPRAMTFMANMPVRSNKVDGGLVDLPLVGLVTNTDGTVIFFEAVGRPALGTEVSPDPDAGVPAYIAPAWTLRHANESSLSGAATNFYYEDAGNVAYLKSPGNCLEDGGIGFGIQSCSVATGLGDSVAELVRVTFQGVIPGLAALPTTDVDGQTFPLPAGAPSDRVVVGDQIVPSLMDGGVCADLAVSSVSTTALGTSDVIPPECTARSSFSVRAADPTPYVVVGTISGYIGRASDQATFQSAPGRVYYRPDPKVHDPALPPPPALAFSMAVREPDILRDFRWEFVTTTGFEPLFYVLSTDSTGWPGYHLPYGVVAMPDTPKIFLSYPSVPRTTLLGSGAVIEFNPALMSPSEANVAVSASYR
jgi:hypothetical protein